MPTPNPRADPHRAARTPVLLATQLLFNIGFYAVVPFLALVLTDDFALAATTVGLVLGVRTFAQQGMFLVGGVLADRFGARRMILLGCGVRVSGFVLLAGALLVTTSGLAIFVVGTVLTGLGGALFSPGLNILLADAERRRPDGRRSRASLFAWLSIAGELGAVAGPLVGAALFGWGFAAVALCGAGLFVAIGAFLALALPRDREAPALHGGTGRPGRWWALRDRRFVAFSSAHAADLLAYNQLYLALPLALAQTADPAAATALMFACVSALTLALQIPIARWCARVGPPRALRTGYLTAATGFLVAAGGSLATGPGGDRVAVVVVSAALVTLGHMTTHPTALSLVPAFARTRPTGSYFGLLATCGGVAVLVGNLVAGALLTSDATTPAAWLFLLAPLVVAAFSAPRLVARTTATPRHGG